MDRFARHPWRVKWIHRLEVAWRGEGSIEWVRWKCDCEVSFVRTETVSLGFYSVWRVDHPEGVCVCASVVECGVSHCFPVILWFTAAQLGVWCACGRPSWDPSVGLLVCACVIEAYRRFGEKRTLYYSTCTCRYLSMQNTSVCYICCFHNALSFVSVFENLCFLFIFPVFSPLL